MESSKQQTPAQLLTLRFIPELSQANYELFEIDESLLSQLKEGATLKVKSYLSSPQGNRESSNTQKAEGSTTEKLFSE